MSVETEWGVSRFLVIETPGSQAIKIFSSAKWSFDVESADEVTVTGTVKGFDSYQGKAQTVLTRTKQV